MLLYYTFHQNIFFDWIYSSSYDWSQVAIAFHEHISTFEQNIYIMDMALSLTLLFFFTFIFSIFMSIDVMLKARLRIACHVRVRTN